VVAAFIEPALGLLADRGHRRALVLTGGVLSALVLVGNAVATGFPMLLVAFILGAPAAGAFVTLAQTVLMDAAPDHHERSMARWVFVGSIGVTTGPLLIAAASLAGLGWRPVMWMLAGLGLLLTLMARKLPLDTVPSEDEEHASVRSALNHLRNPEVRRWLTVIETADLLVDVFFSFLAVYLVDVAGADPTQASFAVSLFSMGGIAGSALLLPMLPRYDGLNYMRGSAMGAAALFAVFLIADPLAVKIAAATAIAVLGSGWYTIPKARLFSALPGRSGIAVALESSASLLGSQTPLVIGAVSASAGLGSAMWLLMLAPVSILALVPRRGQLNRRSRPLRRTPSGTVSTARSGSGSPTSSSSPPKPP